MYNEKMMNLQDDYIEIMSLCYCITQQTSVSALFTMYSTCASVILKNKGDSDVILESFEVRPKDELFMKSDVTIDFAKYTLQKLFNRLLAEERAKEEKKEEREEETNEAV